MPSIHHAAPNPQVRQQDTCPLSGTGKEASTDEAKSLESEEITDARNWRSVAPSPSLAPESPKLCDWLVRERWDVKGPAGMFAAWESAHMGDPLALQG